MDKKTVFTRFRDSVTGLFTSAEDAARRPRETEEEQGGKLPAAKLLLRYRRILSEAIDEDRKTKSTTEGYAILRRAIMRCLHNDRELRDIMDPEAELWQKDPARPRKGH